MTRLHLTNYGWDIFLWIRNAIFIFYYSYCTRNWFWGYIVFCCRLPFEPLKMLWFQQFCQGLSGVLTGDVCISRLHGIPTQWYTFIRYISALISFSTFVLSTWYNSVFLLFSLYSVLISCKLSDWELCFNKLLWKIYSKN